MIYVLGYKIPISSISQIFLEKMKCSYNQRTWSREKDYCEWKEIVIFWPFRSGRLNCECTGYVPDNVPDVSLEQGGYWLMCSPNNLVSYNEWILDSNWLTDVAAIIFLLSLFQGLLFINPIIWNSTANILAGKIILILHSVNCSWYPLLAKYLVINHFLIWPIDTFPLTLTSCWIDERRGTCKERFLKQDKNIHYLIDWYETPSCPLLGVCEMRSSITTSQFIYFGIWPILAPF